MSNQSLHELFEGLGEEEPAGREAQPEPRAPRERRERPAGLIPWIVVGAVTVVALIASVLIVTTARGADEAEPAPAPTTQTDPSSTPDPVQTPEPTDEPDEPEDSDAVPDVEVGSTFDVPIEAWGVTAQASNKFGSVSYKFIDGDNSTLILSSGLIDSLPASCSAMHDQWGVKKSGGDYELVKPAERCDDASAVYDEIWGLMAALVDSIK